MREQVASTPDSSNFPTNFMQYVITQETEFIFSKNNQVHFPRGLSNTLNIFFKTMAETHTPLLCKLVQADSPANR